MFAARSTPQRGLRTKEETQPKNGPPQDDVLHGGHGHQVLLSCLIKKLSIQAELDATQGTPTMKPLKTGSSQENHVRTQPKEKNPTNRLFVVFCASVLKLPRHDAGNEYLWKAVASVPYRSTRSNESNQH